MGAPTEIYVDPSIAAASGSGTVGDPYGDVQHALDTVTRDSTNGDRFNIKAGTDEVLAAALSLATYGNPSISAPLIFQGYTAAAGDGGIGGISGDDTYSVLASATIDHVAFINMHLHSSGSATIVQLDSYALFSNCEINGTSGTGLDLDKYGLVIGCHVHDCDTRGIDISIGCTAYRNYVKNCGIGIIAGFTSGAFENIVWCGASDSGIKLSNNAAFAFANSVYGGTGTGTGISPDGTSRFIGILNNVIEGFSGVGGVGIDLSTFGTRVMVHGGNSVRSATTIEGSVSDKIWHLLEATETLTADPFTDAANDDFTPVDTGSVKESTVPATIGGSSSP